MTTRLGFPMHSKLCKDFRFLDAVAQSYRTLREQYLTDIQNVEFGCRRLKEPGKFRILKLEPSCGSAGRTSGEYYDGILTLERCPRCCN